MFHVVEKPRVRIIKYPLYISMEMKHIMKEETPKQNLCETNFQGLSLTDNGLEILEGEPNLEERNLICSNISYSTFQATKSS